MLETDMNQNLPKIALLSQSTSQQWISCQTIYRNLVQAYTSIFKDSELYQFQLSPNYSNYEAHNTAKEIISKNVEKIVFVDYAPHPEKFIKILNEIRPKQLPELIFHK